MTEKKTQPSADSRPSNRASSSSSSSSNGGRKTNSKLPDGTADASRDKDPGLLGRVAESATRLASGFTRSGAHGASLLGEQSLSAAKAGQQQEDPAASASQMWMAESRSHKELSAASEDSAAIIGSSGTAAASFRLAARTTAAQEHNTQLKNTHGHHTVQTIQEGLQATEHPSPTTSHQVFLAEELDGQGVTAFLTQSMPTSMDVGGLGGVSSGLSGSAQQRSRHSVGTAELTDPVMYLQGSTYALDMESADHQVPLDSQGAPGSQLAQASPSSLNKSWSEHGASVLEEWQLNEAWDRAWMDTAWTSARKREKAAEGAKPEPVLPSNKNLSYLLKPRM
ncbi:hypothetical protein H4R20_006389 [Coemansia guatemalensis]|uniref:Uncharacterized protein n=1 Tax=Coemansia guatemalensis TaxID=2761395 RepID=A0A9W8LPX1_9FUNG|nr:hypothetical protein H4R20_006389 [Coemansia guatemalensis]